MHFAYVQYNHVHSPDAEKCPRDEEFAKDPGSQLWDTVWVRRPCKRCWSVTTEMGSNSYINNSCGRSSEESTTSTYFLPENKDWDDVIFILYGPWIHLQKGGWNVAVRIWFSPKIWPRLGSLWSRDKSGKPTTVDRFR